MERRICVTLIAIFALMSGLCKVQASYRKTVYDAYVSGNMQNWKKVIEEMEKNELTDEQKVELLDYYCGYTAFLIGNKQNKKAKRSIANAEKIADDILKKSPENPSALACKGSLLSFKIALNKMKAVGLMGDSKKCINQAYQLDSTNVRALADKANMLWYMPKMMGGDKGKSLELLSRSIALMEEREEHPDNWFYLYALASLAKNYRSNNMNEEAEKTYRKLLAFEPDFKWVKDRLYPRYKMTATK